MCPISVDDRLTISNRLLPAPRARCYFPSRPGAHAPGFMRPSRSADCFLRRRRVWSSPNLSHTVLTRSFDKLQTDSA